MAQAAPYQFVATVTDNGCPPKIANQIFSIKVNPSPLPPAPAVSITQSPPGAICNGTVVTFTAIPTFGGTSPVYQWQVNGVNVGVNSNTYTSSTLINGDVITVSMTSNSTCVSSFGAVSPPVVMVVNPFASPQVSISSVPPNPICAGTNVTFTALPVNPGPSPVYQWTVNGINAGANSPVFSSSTLTMASQVSVSLTSDPACPSAISNVINMVVNPVLTPSVLITSDNIGAICPGQLVTFTAFPTNGGAPPVYQWQVNGVNVGINSNTFTSSTLNNGDNVSVILTSGESCITTPTANSNVINIVVTAPTAPSVSIASNPSGPICAGDNVIFSATPSFGGSAPTYQWYINGVFTGFTGSIFATANLVNNNQVSVIMTSSLSCVTTATANSNVIVVTVNPIINLNASITANPAGPVCPGTPITFTANVVNGGSSPSFQWQLNGANTGVNSATFSGSAFADQDVVRVIVTSNQVCVSPVNFISNQLVISILPTVIPSVSITPVPAGPVCAGTNITFTATPLSGGASPTYQWTVNGVISGGSGATFSTSSLNDGDVVQATLFSNASCPVPASVGSNQVVASIIPLVTPSAAISVAPLFPVCEGTQVTFTAITAYGGASPTFQWRVNGVAGGTNSNVFTTSTLNDGDTVLVRMISNQNCAVPTTVFSNFIVADILPYLSPVVSIGALPGLTVCAGDSIYFTANGVNGGVSPFYQWYLNGLPSGSNSNNYSGTFSNGDSIHVILTSSYLCLNQPSDTSNVMAAVVNPNLTPSVGITVNPVGAVCPGDLLTFTAAPVNGGLVPVYEWFVNGLQVPGNAAVYSSATLQNGDLVRARLISSETCLTSPSAGSNNIMVVISPNITPGITISVNPAFPICDGDTVTFSTSYTGAGASPMFDWRVNGISVGVSSQQFTTNQLSNNDMVDVVLQSSAFCALPATDTSNIIVAVVDPLLTPVAFITATPPGTFCDGAEITYSASGIFGGTLPGYQWMLNGIFIGSNNDTLISSTFMDGDTLQLIYTSNERCLAVNPVLSNQIIIDRLPPLQPVIIAPDEVCFGTEVTMSVTGTGGTGGPYYYSWDNGLGDVTSITFIPGQTTTFTVTMDDSCSTKRSVSKTIQVNPLPEPGFVVMPPSSTILSPWFEFTNTSTNANSWVWWFGDGNTSNLQHPDHYYEGHGYYTVQLTATSDDGCVDSTSQRILIEDVVTFYIPNAFTPNGDGVNDVFGITGNSVSGYSLNIYGRWGQPVFKSDGPFKGWNGNDQNGNPAPDGVYVYSLKVFNDPEAKTHTGTVTLVR